MLVKRPYGEPGGLGGIIVRDSIGGEQFQYRTSGPLPSFSRVLLFRKAPADGTFTVTLGLAGYAEAYFDDFRVEVIEQDAGPPDGRNCSTPRPGPDARLASAPRSDTARRSLALHRIAPALEVLRAQHLYDKPAVVNTKGWTRFVCPPSLVRTRRCKHSLLPRPLEDRSNCWTWCSASSRYSVILLNQPDELIALARYDIEIVVGELSPRFLDLAPELLPIAFHGVPVHDLLLWLVSRDRPAMSVHGMTTSRLSSRLHARSVRRQVFAPAQRSARPQT